MSPSVVVGIVVAVVASWALLIALLWLVRPRDVSLRELIGIVPDVLRLVRDLIADRSTPIRVRVALIVLLVWLISPIDLIPDFIPVLGPLDDVVVAVLVLRYVRRRLGEEQLRRRWRGSADGFALLTGVMGKDAA
ncbi:MAG: YkvA family protein [Chloroflexota bacterium]|nr:YkvA family protein [Chloroflexota bacterium]